MPSVWKVIAGLLLLAFLLTSTHLAAVSPGIPKARTLGHDCVVTIITLFPQGSKSKPSNVMEIQLSKKPNPAILESSQAYVDSIVSPGNSSISNTRLPSTQR